MATIECPDCKAKVSELARACPKCGRPGKSEGSYGIPLPDLYKIIVEQQGRHDHDHNQNIRIFIGLLTAVLGGTILLLGQMETQGIAQSIVLFIGGVATILMVRAALRMHLHDHERVHKTVSTRKKIASELGLDDPTLRGAGRLWADEKDALLYKGDVGPYGPDVKDSETWVKSQEPYRRTAWPVRIFKVFLLLGTLLILVSIGYLAVELSAPRTRPECHCRAAAQPTEAGAKEVRVRRLVLVDEKGRTRATFGAEEDAPALVLLDEKGTTRVRLVVLRNGSKLDLCDGNGNVRAVLGADKDGPMLGLSDEKGKPRAVLIVASNGPALGLLDKDGRSRARLGMGTDGPTLILYDKNRKVKWHAP